MNMQLVVQNELSEPKALVVHLIQGAKYNAMVAQGLNCCAAIASLPRNPFCENRLTAEFMLQWFSVKGTVSFKGDVQVHAHT